MSEQRLLQALLDFDGKRVDPLEAAYAELPATPQLLRDLCGLLDALDAKTQIASSWLLRRYLEAGAALPAEETEMALSLLLRESAWQAKLHMLQALERLTLSSDLAADLWLALQIGTEDDNKFIRAWSYHGLAVIAEGHAGYRDEALAALAVGEGDAAASVRARIRGSRRRFGLPPSVPRE